MLMVYPVTWILTSILFVAYHHWGHWLRHAESRAASTRIRREGAVHRLPLALNRFNSTFSSRRTAILSKKGDSADATKMGCGEGQEQDAAKTGCKRGAGTHGAP